MHRTGRRPTHPGAILREDILPAAAVTVTELAQRLGVSRRTISEIVHEHRPVTTDVAHRLARAFGNSPEFWLRLQQAVDVWEALEENRDEYARIRPLPGAGPAGTTTREPASRA